MNRRTRGIRRTLGRYSSVTGGRNEDCQSPSTGTSLPLPMASAPSQELEPPEFPGRFKALITASVDRVDQGTALVDQAGRAMEDVVGAIKRVGEIVGDISVASAEQSAGFAKVGTAVNQMDQAVQQNSALVEESAAASDSLKHQARQLVEAVSVFSLKVPTRSAI